jgi:hypothetical protein
MSPWLLFDLILTFIFACALALLWLSWRSDNREEERERRRRDFGRNL